MIFAWLILLIGTTTVTCLAVAAAAASYAIANRVAVEAKVYAAMAVLLMFVTYYTAPFKLELLLP